MTIPARIRPVVPEDLLRSVDHLGRACFATLRSGGQSSLQREAFAKERWSDDRITPMVVRAASSPATTASSGWAGSLASQAVEAFLDSLVPESAAAKLIAAGMKVSLDGVASVLVPGRNGAPSTNVPWITESGAIPVRQLALSAAQVGPQSKLAVICALTRELAEHSSAEETVSALLREDAAATLEAAIFSTAAASSSRQAGILNGVTPITAASGGGDAALLADLTALGAAPARAGGPDGPIFIMAPEQALKASLRGASNRPPIIWSSPALAAGTVIAIEPRAFVSAFGSIPTIKVATSGVVHMEGAMPAPLSVAGTPNTVAAPIASAFQANLVLLSRILDCAWAMRGQGMVSYLTGATW